MNVEQENSRSDRHRTLEIEEAAREHEFTMDAEGKEVLKK